MAVAAVLATAVTGYTQDAYMPTGAIETMSPTTDWGGASNVIVTYEASDFELFTGTFGGIDPSTAARFCGGGPCGWFVGVQLPAGASLTAVEVDACDTSATAEVAVAVFRGIKAGGATTPIGAFQGTGVAAVPGCAVFTRTIAPAETVNNLNNTYFIDIVSGPTNATRFKAVRVIYRLQVSPAPGVATFPNDVPTSHPFFRFVEAMAASGLTGGCAAGSFCPDNPVTRGQLSVFLSVALGLHFPN